MKHACDNPKCEFYAIGLSDEQVCFVTFDKVVHQRHRHSSGRYYCDACRAQIEQHPGILLRIGDVVSRGHGEGDEHIILSFNDIGDMMEIECVKGSDWVTVGERECVVSDDWELVRIGHTCEICGAPATGKLRDIRSYPDGYRMRTEPFGEWHYYCSGHNRSPVTVE